MATRRRKPAIIGSGDDMSRLLITVRGNRTQGEAAALSGLTQTKISRAETGRFPLSDDEAAPYARALGASPEQEAQLVEFTAAHRARNTVGRRQVVDSAHVIQRRIADLQERTRALRAWVPDLVPGILQTEAYTRAVVGFDPPDTWWAPRRTQKAVLDDPGREVHLIVCEAALRWGVGTATVMVDQVRHLVEMSERPPLRLGIVPIDVVHPIAPPRTFYVYDTHTASVSTDLGVTFVGEVEASGFLGHHAELSELATYGDESRAVLMRIFDLFDAQR